MNEKNCFFRLLQSAVGNEIIPIVFSKEEWEACYEQAAKHSLLAFAFPVVQKYLKNEDGKRIEPLFSQWLAYTVQINDRNTLLSTKNQ